jgi:hypothetical protein
MSDPMLYDHNSADTITFAPWLISVPASDGGTFGLINPESTSTDVDPLMDQILAAWRAATLLTLSFPTVSLKSSSLELMKV